MIVNDVASINVDAKLVRNSSSNTNTDGTNNSSSMMPPDTVELQNGCVCCRCHIDSLPALTCFMTISIKIRKCVDSFDSPHFCT